MLLKGKYFDIIKLLMPERYTLSNRHDDKSKDTSSKTKSKNKNGLDSSSSIPSYIWIILAISVLIITNVATYFVTSMLANRKLVEVQNKADDLQKQLSENDTNNPSSQNSKNPGSVSSNISADTKARVQEAVGSNNYQNLAGLLSGSVNVIKAGSGSSLLSVQQAIESLNYLNGSSGGWNWNLTPEQLAQYQQGSNAQYFGSNAVVGQSANGYVVSIIVDDGGQVTTIFMSPTPQDAGATPAAGEGNE